MRWAPQRPVWVTVVSVLTVAAVLFYGGVAWVLAGPATEAAASTPPPVVEVWAPDVYPSAAAFEARASALGCSPVKWAWTVPSGCVAVAASTSARIQIRCTSGGPSFKVTAKAQGGGCAGATGSSSTVVVTSVVPVAVTLPVCGDVDGAQPAAVVTLPPAGIYYRPGVQSTGRLDLQVAGGKSVRLSAECVEPNP